MNTLYALKSAVEAVKRFIHKIKLYIPDYISFPLLKLIVPVSVLDYTVGQKRIEMFGSSHFVKDINFRYKSGALITGIDCEGRYEEAFTKMFVAKLKDCSFFIDVGAANGFFSMIASKYVSAEMIHCFEPDPFLRFILEKNNKKFCGSRMHINAQFVSSSTQGKNITLDDYCLKNKIKPGLIKMDIEGGEFEALAGMKRICAQDRPVMLIEYHLRKLRRQWAQDPYTLIELLRSYNYSLRFNGHNWHLIQNSGKRDELWHSTVPNEINCAILAEPVKSK